DKKVDGQTDGKPDEDVDKTPFIFSLGCARGVCRNTCDGHRRKNERAVERDRPEINRYSIRGLIYTALKSQTGFYDAHCHLDILLDKEAFKGTFDEYQKCRSFLFPRNYKGCIASFCKPSTFTDATVWTKYLSQKNVWATFGCHPCNANEFDSVAERNLQSVLCHPKVKGLGEIGLDYSTRNKCPREIQMEVFRRQLIIGYSRQLPLVIHCRDANEDCILILLETIPYDYTFHLHCFAENWYWADRWLNTFPNVYIGITNLVTFASRQQLREVAEKIPLDRLLLETDAPYCRPKSIIYHDIDFSNPGMAMYAGVQIAAERDISADEVFCWTARNTEFVYKLKKKAKKTRA
ncbi:putative deoxyribonuclease TATDN2, partial [Trichonephila inaurata madagascariensis]